TTRDTNERANFAFMSLQIRLISPIRTSAVTNPGLAWVDVDQTARNATNRIVQKTRHHYLQNIRFIKGCRVGKKNNLTAGLFDSCILGRGFSETLRLSPENHPPRSEAASNLIGPIG